MDKAAKLVPFTKKIDQGLTDKTLTDKSSCHVGC